MPVVSSGNLALLRREHHKHAVYFSWLIPPVLWNARINDGGIVKGETSIVFDGGSGSFFSMVEGVQEVWVGTAAGANDVGRLRIKSISSGDAGVTGTLTVGGHSHPLQDGQFLTFFHDYPLKPKFSFIDPGTENWFMDDDVNYTDRHDEPRPVVVAGPQRADFIDVTTSDVVFNVDSASSYAIESGASISSYGLSVASTAATPVVSFSSVTGLGDITFDTPGYYWAKYTVTDSNGKSMDSYRLYMIHDSTLQTGPFPWTFCERLQLENDWENGGWTAGLRASDDFDFANIPDHALCIVWQEGSFDGTVGSVTFLPDKSKAVFVGYVREDSDTQDMASGFGEVDLVLSTIEGRLRRLFNFSTSLIVKNGNPTEWYEYRQWQTPGTIVHDLFLWRSTVLEIADVIGLKDDTVNRMFQAFEEGNVYDNANNFLYTEAIRKRILCDQGGRVHLSSDQQLLVSADRAALVTAFPIIQTAAIADYGESLVLESRQEFEVPFITANGIFWNGTDFDGDGKPKSTGDFCAIAPGGKPLYDGPNPQDFPKQTVTSQANLNAIAGRYEAKINNPIGEIVLKFHGAYHTVLDCAYSEEFTMDLQASENPRGITWSDKPLYLRHVQAVYDSRMGAWEVHGSFEPENITTDGVTTECPSFPPLGGMIPDVPLPDVPSGPAGAIPGALITGASVNFKTALGDLWTQLLTENVIDLIADPYWRTKQASVAPNTAILFRCGLGYIKRSTDAFISIDVDVTPSTNPPNDAGDSPAPTVGAITFEELDANWTISDAFIVLATWQNGSSEWRSWLAYTVNNGTSWSWASIDVPAGGGGGGCITDGLEGQNLPDDFRGGGADGSPRNAVEVSADKYVMFYRDDDSVVYLQAFDVSGSTITLGTRIDAGLHVLTGITQICKVDTNKFACGTNYHPGASNKPAALVGTVSGLTITVGSVIPVFTAREEAQLGDPEYNSVACPDGTTLIMGHARSIIAGSPCISTGGRRNLLISGTISGLGITWSTEICDIHTRTVSTDVLGASTGGLSYMYVRESGTSHFVCAMNDNSGVNDIVKIVAGTTGMTMGSVVSVHADAGVFVPSLNLKSLTSTKGVLVYNAVSPTQPDDGSAIYAVVFNRSGTVVTLETPKLLYDGGPDFNAPFRIELDPLSTTEMVVKARQAAGSGACDTVWHLLITGNVISIIDQCDDYFDPGSIMELLGRSSGEYIWIRGETAVPVPASVILMDIAELADCSVAGGLEARGLGVNIGKSTGSKAWVTANVNNQLHLVEFALPALTRTNNELLGDATFAETAAKSYLCYPFVPYGLEDTVYVFGRMNDPASLGNPVHIIKTVNGGTSFTLVEGNWLFDHCGALAVTQLDEIFAIRNQGAKAGLYRDNSDEVLIAKYTLPFDAPVAPHGMLLDYSSRDVYVGSNFADPIMVVLVPPPHLTTIDLTFNHDNTAGIESVIGL